MPRHGRVSREDSLTRSVPNDCHGPDGGGRDRAFRGLAEQGWNPIAACARALLEATLGCGLPPYEDRMLAGHRPRVSL